MSLLLAALAACGRTRAPVNAWLTATHPCPPAAAASAQAVPFLLFWQKWAGTVDSKFSTVVNPGEAALLLSPSLQVSPSSTWDAASGWWLAAPHPLRARAPPLVQA